MILRRVIAHFRKQEWTAIGLDFLIVVVGVLFAFQVTAWNTAQEERNRADAALAALLSESRESVDYLEMLIARVDETIDAQKASIEALIAGELPEGMTHQEFVVGVTLTRIFIPPNPPRSTYDSLLANGDINLIDDPTVMRQLARYYSRVAATQEYASRLAASNSGDYHPAIISYYDPSAPDYRRQDADFATLAADPQFLEDSVDVLRSVSAVQESRRGLLDTARETYASLCLAARSDCADGKDAPQTNINQSVQP